MTTPRLFIDVSEVTSRLGAIDERLADPTELLEWTAEKLEAHARLHVDEAAGPSGPWLELSPMYAEWKAKAHPGKAMGHLTEEMYDGFKHEAVLDELRAEAGVYDVDHAEAFNLARPFGYITPGWVEETVLEPAGRYFVNGELA